MRDAAGMNRIPTLLAAAAILALAGCATTSSSSSDAASSNPKVGITTHSVVTSGAGTSPRPSTKPTPSSTYTCDPGPDVFVWTRVPGLPDSAQRIGSKYAADCTSSFAFIQRSSPTGQGYCTEAAWASDNPGYDENATPAKRLKKVQVMVGPAC